MYLLCSPTAEPEGPDSIPARPGDLVVRESRRDLTASTWLRTGGTSNQRRALDDIGAAAAKNGSEPVAAGQEEGGRN